MTNSSFTNSLKRLESLRKLSLVRYLILSVFMLGAFLGKAQNPFASSLPTDEEGCSRGVWNATWDVNLNLPSPPPSYVLQWEADTGTGFVSVPSGGSYGFGGVNGTQLILFNPDGCSPFQQDGTEFRCRILITSGSGGTYVSGSAELILHAPIDSSDFKTKYGEFTGVGSDTIPNDTVCEGGSTWFEITNPASADTCTPLKKDSVSYQWQYQPFGSGSWTNVPVSNPTANSAKLVLTNVPLSHDMRKYRCETQAYSCVPLFYSDTVTLVVDPIPFAEFDTTNIYVCEGSPFTIDVNISNSALSANRGSLATGWEVYFDTSLMGGYAYLFSNAPLDSLSGVGNGSPAISFTHSGISTTGIYTLKLDSIVNDSSSLRCPRALSGIVTINVYPRPNVTLVSSSPRKVCEEDSVCFTMEVTNAVFNGAGQDWLVYLNDPSNTIDGGSGFYAGNGNSSITFCTSTGLLSDSVRISIDSIKLVGTAADLIGDSCLGTVGPQDSLDILILPKPYAALGEYSAVWKITATGAIAPGPYVAPNTWLSEAGAAPNDTAGAHYFNFTPTHDMRLDSIALQIYKPSAGAEDFKIYYRPTSYIGNEHSSTGWTLANTVSKSGVMTGVVATQFGTGGVQLTGGTTYGFYVHATTDGNTSVRTLINHWPATFRTTFSGPFASALSGLMGVRDFIVADSNAPYSNSMFAKGLWVTYRGGAVVSGDTVRVCEGDSFDFDFVVGNVTYNNTTPLNWELTFTDPSGTMSYTSPVTGTGDSAMFDRIYTAGMVPGTYTFALTSVKLLPTSGAPVPPDCIHTIDDEFFTFEIVPKINAEFNKDTFNLCYGSGDVFDIEIDNALFDGQPVSWELHYTDASGILAAFSNPLTGAGNSTPSFTVPNSLSVGTYYIYLDSIKSVGTDPICLGTTGPMDTIVINVLPYPTADLEVTWLGGMGTVASYPDTLRICEYDSVEIKIEVSNAVWKGIDLAWTLNIVDATGTMSAVQTGYGDTIIRDTSSSALAPGRYVIELIDIQLDTLGLTCKTNFDSTRVVLEMYSRPHVAFSTDTLSVCQDDTSNFDVNISNSLFEGIPQAWSLYFTDTSGLIWTGSPLQDTGNLSPTFGIPTTLPVGQYQIVLDSIVRDYDPRCMGINDAPDTLIINVYPKPIVTLTPSTDTVCEGITTSFTVDVSNTHWFAGDSVNWRLDFLDGLGSTLGVSPLTGYGDTNVTYTTSASLSVGTHTLVLTSITNLDDTCTRYLNDTLAVTVNFLPQLTILDVMDPICDGDSLRVSFRVDSMNPGDSWSFTYTVVPESSSALPATVSGVADGAGSYTGVLTLADTFGYGPYSRLIDWGPVHNLTTGCIEIDSVPDSIFYVHPLPAVDIQGSPTVCSGHFDPVTGLPVTGWEDVASFNAVVSGTTVGSLNKDWTFWYHVEDTVSGYVSTTHWLSGTGDNGGAAYSLDVPDSLFYYFDASGDERGFKLIVDSIKITSGLALCNDLLRQDSVVFTVNPNPYFVWDVPDSLCLGSALEWDIIATGMKVADDWRVGFSWDQTAYDPTPYFGPRDFDETGSDTFNVTFPNTGYPIYASMWYLWSDTLVNKTTGCFYKPEKLDSVRVDPPTIADSLFGNTTVCEDDNSGYLYMSGHQGVILYWEASYDEGFTWDTVRTVGNFPEMKPVTFSKDLDTMWYTDKTFKTRYRVWVKSGACDKDVSNVAHVYVHPRPDAAIVDLDDFICTGDSAKLRINVVNVPTSNDWTVYYTTTSPAGNGTISGSGTGIFTHYISGLSGTPSHVTLDSIYNKTTTCHNTVLSDNVDSVYVYPYTLAGTLAAADTVCRDLNSGTLTLTGYTGAVVKWQSQELGGGWTDIGVIADSYTYLNLDITTTYRVVVQNGTCDPDTSNEVAVTVMALPHASISGSDTICPGTTLTLDVEVDSTYGGDWAITYLEGSVTKVLTGTGDGTHSLVTGSIFSTTDVTLQKIGVTTPVMNYAACENTQIDNPGTATVTIIDQATATINDGPDSICSGSSATMTVIVSNILSSDSVKVDWSIDGTPQTALVFTGAGSHNFTIPASSLVAAALPASTDFVITVDTVTNLSSTEPCAGLVDSDHTIKVHRATVGGTTSSDATVCIGNNSGTIKLVDNIGTILYWESSNNGTSWTQVNNTTDELTYTNLTDTTSYRAVSKNGLCGLAYSTATKISTKELSATIVGGDTICSGLTDDLTITIENTDAATWYIAILEGTRYDTISGTGSSYTHTTGSLNSTTDVSLQSIWTGTKSTPDCYKSLNNISTATVTVLTRPFATIASGPSRLCEGETFTFTVNVTSVPTGDAWTLTYDHDGTSGTVSGAGSGTFTASSLKATTTSTDVITLSSITATSGSHSCDSTLSETHTIMVDEFTVGGTTSGTDLVCKGMNGGTVVLSGETGSVIYWESSEDSSSWTQVNETTTTLTYANLNDTTWYRAVVKNGECGIERSTATKISVKELGATIVGGDTICSGLTDDLTITIENTDAATWYIAILEGTRYDTISGTGSSYTHTTGSLNSTTDVSLQSIWTGTKSTPDCYKSLNNISTATVTVLTRPFATIASGPSRLCEGETFTFTVNVTSVPTGDAWTLTYDHDGTSGTVSGSGSGTFTASSLKATTTSTDVITLSSITATSGSHSCDSTLSETHTIMVDEFTVGGTTSGTDLVCNGMNSGTIKLTGHKGSVIRWESSTNGSAWVQINNYTTSLNYLNITDTTQYRAIVKNGECNIDSSTITTINVKEDPIATISGGDTICSGLTDDLTITIDNTYGLTWYIALLEGTRTDTISGTGSSITYTTNALFSTSDIVLQSIWNGTKSSPDCYNTLNNVSTATVTVLARPYATIASGPSRLCEGASFTFAVSVNNVPTGDAWLLRYEQDGTPGSLKGTGSGTFTASSVKGVSPTSETITLKSISSTQGTKSCDSTLSDSWTISVDPTTVAGTIADNDTVCMGGSGSAGQSAAGTGLIVKWQSKVGSAGTWIDINNTTNSNPYYNVLDTTYLRAVYQSGVCPTANSKMVVVVPKPIPTATIATTSTDDTICAGNTADFEITVSNVEVGQTFSVSYLEGSTLKTTPTMTQVAGGVHTLTTGTLNTGTTIELRSIKAKLTAAGLTCGQNLSGAITIEVLENPKATITSIDSRLCHGASANFVVNVSNVPTGDTWSLVYSQDGVDSTIKGSGSGSYSVSTSRTVTATSETITLKSITNTSTGDMCKTSLTDSRVIDVDATTVAGTIGADDTVCWGGSGTMKQTAPGVGSIVGWQSRVKGSSAWVGINNTTTSLSFSSLTDTTDYRAVYKNGVCDVAYSNEVTATPKPLPTATIMTQPATDTICAGNKATLSVTVNNIDAGDSAVITYVEGSVSKTIGYRLTSSPQTFDLVTGSLATTTDLVLQTIKNVDPTVGQPECGNNLTNVAKATVTVIDLPSASIVSGPDTLCQDDQITFTVNVANVKATDDWRLLYTLEGDIDTLYGTGPTTVTHTDYDPNTAQSAIISLTEILNTSNIGTCKSDDTDDWEIYIFKPTVAGTIEAPDTICKGGSTSINEEMGTTKEGRIIEWEYRANSATAWTTIPNNNTTLNIMNLLETTSYRGVYKNGVCDTMHSNVITIEVRELPLATLSGSAVVCAGNRTDLTITVSNVGSAQIWEIDYLEGTTSKTVSDTGSGTFTLNVGGFITNTDITLSEIRTVTGTPQCVNDKLTNNATVTVEVNQRPYASLNSVTSPLCETDDVMFSVTVGNVRSNEAWTVTYNVNNTASSGTLNGSGPGTFTVNYGKVAAVNPVQDSYTVSLVSIVNNTTTCDSTLSGSATLLIDAKSAPGTMLNEATVCYADNSGEVLYFGGNGDVVRWESSTDGGSTWTGIVNTDTFHNYSDLTDTTLFRVVMQNGTCAEAAAVPVSINVRPLPVATISGSDTICANETASLTVSASNTYGENWNVSYLAGTILDTLSVNGPLTSGTIVTNTITTNTDVTLKKIWMTSGAPQCYNNDLNNNATATVEVNELPAVSLISLEDSVCTGSPATGKLSINNVRSNETWTAYWSVNGGIADSRSGTGAGSFNFSTVGLTVNPSIVRLVDIRNTSTGCRFLPTDQDTVFVSPLTAGGTLSGVDTVCYDDNSGRITLGADAIGDVVKWEASEDGGTTWTDINNTNSIYDYADLTTTTTYRVLVKSGVCNEEYSTTVQVVVRPLPVAEITGVGANSVCEGSTTWITYSVSNVMASQSWTLKYLEGSTTKTVSGTGSMSDTIWTGSLKSTTDVTLQTIVITSGDPLCANMNLTNNQTTTITVIPDPTASIIDFPTPVCTGTNPLVTVLVGDIKTGESWTLIYRVNNGTNQSTSGIGPGKFAFNIGSLTNVGANGLRLVSITNTGSTPNCTAGLSDSVTINVDATSIGGTISGPDVVCYNGSGTLTLSGNRGNVEKWQSSTDGINYFDIANTSSTLNFANLTQKTWYRAEVKNGSCDPAFSSVKIVDIQALPTVSIVNPTQDICSGTSTSITVNVANVTGTSTWTLNYTENGTPKTFPGTGTSGTINLGPYTSTTTIVITGVSVTNGLMCSNTVSETATITVIPNPTATIDSAPDSLCQGDNVTFTIAVDDIATNEDWELDYTIDGVAGATVKGTGSGVFSVNSLRAATTATDVIALTSIKMVSAPGCTTTLTDSKTINVSPTTVPGTLAANSTTVCYGGSATLTLTGKVGDVKNWEYSTNGGATWTVTSNKDTTLTVTNLTETTQYRVYVQSGPCAGAYSNVVTVTVIPEPNATVSSNAKVCPGDAATFTLHVTDVAATDAWSVVYRRNGVAQAPVTGTGPGDFDFTVAGSAYMGNPTLITVDLVSITNTTYGCTNSSLSSSASAKVTPNPVAAFTAANSCEDTVVSFVNNSSIPEGTITTYKWYFGDGDSSSTPDPTHAYANAGTYNVTLVAWSDNGCRGEVTKTITIYDNPVAGFNFSNVCQNEVFSATDASTVANGSIVSWFWTFGDGSTSNAKNPTHNYSTSGNYDVMLTVTTDNGCTNTVSKEVTIYILPEASFVAEPVCEDDVMNFVNTSAIGYGTMSYEWDFDGQGASTDEDPNFTFAGFGQFNVQMIATSNNGCKDTINRDVTVHPNPTAAFSVDPVCIGETSEFVNSSSVPTGSIVEYFWDFADASFSGLENPTHTYAAPGTYRVNLRVKTDKGCTHDVTEDAIVIALPDVQLVPNDSQHIGGCDSVQLSARSDARTWDWMRNGDTVTTGVASIFASKTGMYKVTVSTATLGVVCYNSDSVYVKVEPLPTVNAWPRDKVSQTIDSISKGQSIELHASGTGYQVNESSFVWDPSGADFLDGTNVGTTVVTSQFLDNDQVFTVVLTDGFGCTASATVTVIVLDDFNLFPYNLITPNNDGMNDKWIIENIWAYPEAEVTIFNRYGMVVYQGSNYDQNQWDGKDDNGKDLPDGAYYYVITHPDHPDTVYKGSINLIKNR